jgi:hypothetical protein
MQDVHDPLDNQKLNSELHITEHTFAYPDHFLNYVRTVRELGKQIKTKAESTSIFKTQFMDFVASNADLKDYVYTDRAKAKQTIVRPYLDNLYARLKSKMVQMQRPRPAIRPFVNKDATTSQENPQTATPAPSITSPIKTTNSPTDATPPPKKPAPEPSIPAFDPSAFIMPTRSRSRGPPPPQLAEQTLKATPAPSRPAVSKLKPALVSNRGRSEKKRERVKFDTLKNQTRIISPKKKIIFDWEVLPPNDPSEDPEHEEALRKIMGGGKYKEQDEIKPHQESPQQPSPKPPKPAVPDPPPEDVFKLFQQENSKKDSEKASPTSDSQTTRLDSKKYNQLKKAIIDNKCSKEEWITFRREFNDLKAPLSEGIVVKKYGRKNVFKADERRFFFIENYTKFTWSKLNATKYDKVFKVADVQAIKLGKETENLKRFSGADEKLCFSIVMADRTIDLEFKNQKEMRQTYYGLKFFFKMGNRFKKNMYLYDCLNDDFPLDIFEEISAERSK